MAKTNNTNNGHKVTADEERPIEYLLTEGYTLEELLKLGWVVDAAGAEKITGMTEFHLRYLARTKQIEHIRRHGSGYFFQSFALRRLFKTVPAETGSSKA